MMELKTNTGVYILWCNKEFVYIGASTNLKSRIKSSIAERSICNDITHLSIIECETKKDSFDLESSMIWLHKPSRNKDLENYSENENIIKKYPNNINLLPKFKIENRRNIDDCILNEDLSMKVKTFEDLTLNHLERKVFSWFVFARKDNKKWCKKPIKKLRKIFNCSKREIKTTLESLIKKGLIETECFFFEYTDGSASYESFYRSVGNMSEWVINETEKNEKQFK